MNKSQKVIKFTKEEGGEWHFPVGDEITEDEVLSLPLIYRHGKGFLWGYIHSFIREDERRLDAFNDGFRIGRTVNYIEGWIPDYLEHYEKNHE